MITDVKYEVSENFELAPLGNDKWEITKYIGFTVENLEIPSTIDGKKITNIGNKLFYYDNNLKNVKIADGIESISDEAFSRCFKLTNITLPQSLEIIGNQAFAGCLNLTNITLPQNLETIGDQAFANCLNLTNIALPKSLETIGDEAFYNTNLETLHFPDNIKSIGAGICLECEKLSSVVLPDHITVIPERAFKKCSSLRSINLPKNLKKIQSNAFVLCSIEEITLPDGLEVIEEYALALNKLKTLIIPKSVKVVGDHSIENNDLTTVIFLSGCEASLGSGIFFQDPSHNSALTSVYIPATITEIGKSFTGVTFSIPDAPKYDEYVQTVEDLCENEANAQDILSYEITHFPNSLTLYCELGSPILDFARENSIKCADYNTNLEKYFIEQENRKQEKLRLQRVEEYKRQQEELKQQQVEEDKRKKEELKRQQEQEAKRRKEELNKQRAEELKRKAKEQSFSNASNEIYSGDFNKHKEKFIVTDRKVTVANNIKILKEGSFSSVALQDKYLEIYFTDDCQLERIEKEAFLGCFNGIQQTLKLPKSLQIIESDAFRGCSGLHTLYVQSACIIKKDAFKGCFLLNTVYIPSSCTVEEGAFDKRCNVIIKDEKNLQESIGNVAKNATNAINDAVDTMKGLWNKFMKK